jgi:hypothetical protein
MKVVTLPWDVSLAPFGTPISVTYVIHVFQMLDTSSNTSRFADTIEYVFFVYASGIAYHVTFFDTLFVDS